MERCGACGAGVDVEGVFPGAKVRCPSCGADVDVALPPGRRSREPSMPGPYRAPSPLPPEPSSAGGATRRRRAPSAACPRCGAGFEEKHDVQECAACGGVFVAREVLDATLAARRFEPVDVGDARMGGGAAAGAGEAAATEVRYLRCPRCEEPMSRCLFGKRSGIVVDVCNLHGTWFDATELDRAARWIAETGDAPPQRAALKRELDVDPEAVRARAELEAIAAREAYVEGRRWGRHLARSGSVLDLLYALLSGEERRP